MHQSPPEHSLHRKLAEVVAAVDWQPKTGRNTQQNYSFVTAEQIKDAVRKHLAERRVMVYVSIEGIERSEWQTKSGTTMFSVVCHGEVTFADGDSGELFTVKAAGEGMDSGDKALNKAQTALLKYALIGNFLIPTGDDPEADSPEVTTRRPAQAPRTAQERPQPAQRTTATPVAPQAVSAELNESDWAGLIDETSPGLAPAAGLSSRDFFDRAKNAGIESRDVTSAAKRLFGADKWKVTDLSDDQRAALWFELEPVKA